MGRVRERKAGADLVDDPGFEFLLLDCGFDDFVEERGWDDDGAIVIDDDDVIGEDCDATAGDGHLPAYEGESGDGGGGCGALAPDGQIGAEDAGEVADDAVGDESGDFADADTLAEDVTEDSGVGDAHSVDHRDASGGHAFDGGAG